jgi:hypothetical protein
MEPEFVKHPVDEILMFPAYIEPELIFIKPEVIEIEPEIVELLSICKVVVAPARVRSSDVV